MVNSLNARDRAHRFLGQQAPQLLEALATQIAQLAQPSPAIPLTQSITTLQSFAQTAADVGLETLPAIAQRLEQILRQLQRQEVALDRSLLKLLADVQDCLQLPLSEYSIFGEFDPAESAQRAEPLLTQLEARLGLSPTAPPPPAMDENAAFFAELMGGEADLPDRREATAPSPAPAQNLTTASVDFGLGELDTDQVYSLFAMPTPPPAATDRPDLINLDEQILQTLFGSSSAPPAPTPLRAGPPPPPPFLGDAAGFAELDAVKGADIAAPPPLTPLDLFGEEPAVSAAAPAIARPTPSPAAVATPTPTPDLIEDILGALFPDVIDPAAALVAPPSPSLSVESLFGEDDPEAERWVTGSDRVDQPTPENLFDDVDQVRQPVVLENLFGEVDQADQPTSENLFGEGEITPRPAPQPDAPVPAATRSNASRNDVITLGDVFANFDGPAPSSRPGTAPIAADQAVLLGDLFGTGADAAPVDAIAPPDQPDQPDQPDWDSSPGWDDADLGILTARASRVLDDLETLAIDPTDAQGEIDLIADAIAAVSRPQRQEMAPPAPSASALAEPTLPQVAIAPQIATAPVPPAAGSPKAVPADQAMPTDLPWADFNARSMDPADQIRLEVMGQQLEQLARQRTLLHDHLDRLQDQQASLANWLATASPEQSESLQRVHDQLAAIATAGHHQLAAQQQSLLTLQQNLIDIQTHSLQLFLGQFAPLAHRLATAQGKAVQVLIHAAPMQLDRTVLDSLHAPLLQLLSCSLTHSLEPIDLRRRRGKPEVGNLTVAAALKGSTLTLEFQDDGWGLDLETIRQEAIEQGWITTAAAQGLDLPALMSRWDATASRQTADSLSRQSVILAMVQDCLRSVQGQFTATTTSGAGSTYTLTLPYPILMTEVLLCQVGDRPVAVLAASIEEVLLPSPTQCRTQAQQRQVQYQAEWIPSYAWAEQFGNRPGVQPSVLTSPAEQSPHLIVLLPTGAIAIEVTALLAQEEVVIKSQDSHAPDRHGLTTLPTGVAVMVWDAIALAQSCVNSTLAPV